MAKANYVLSAFADEASKNFPEQLEALREAGINRIEIRGVDGTNISELTDAQITAVKAQLDAANVTISAIGSPFGKLKVTDAFSKHLNALKRTMGHAAELGAHVFRIFSFYPEQGGASECRAQVIDQLGQMLDAADNAGMVLAHENEKGIFGDVPERCLDLLETFGGRLKCIFDPANFIQCGVKPMDAYEMLKNHIYYFHIKDALLTDGSVVPAGTGDGELRAILADFGGCATTLSVEPHLSVFDGLANLQGEELVHKYVYENNRSAFRAATEAIKTVLAEIGYRETEENQWTR